MKKILTFLLFVVYATVGEASMLTVPELRKMGCPEMWYLDIAIKKNNGDLFAALDECERRGRWDMGMVGYISHNHIDEITDVRTVEYTIHPITLLCTVSPVADSLISIMMDIVEYTYIQPNNERSYTSSLIIRMDATAPTEIGIDYEADFWYPHDSDSYKILMRALQESKARIVLRPTRSQNTYVIDTTKMQDSYSEFLERCKLGGNSL